MDPAARRRARRPRRMLPEPVGPDQRDHLARSREQRQVGQRREALLAGGDGPQGGACCGAPLAHGHVAQVEHRRHRGGRRPVARTSARGVLQRQLAVGGLTAARSSASCSRRHAVEVGDRPARASTSGRRRPAPPPRPRGRRGRRAGRRRAGRRTARPPGRRSSRCGAGRRPTAAPRRRRPRRRGDRRQPAGLEHQPVDLVVDRGAPRRCSTARCTVPPTLSPKRSYQREHGGLVACRQLPMIPASSSAVAALALVVIVPRRVPPRRGASAPIRGGILLRGCDELHRCNLESLRIPRTARRTTRRPPAERQVDRRSSRRRAGGRTAGRSPPMAANISTSGPTARP